MLTPVSLSAMTTDLRISQLVTFSSCRYLARKWMVLSTEMPKAMLKTRIVEALMGIPANPIMAAVKIRGITLGVSDMMTMRHDENMTAMNTEISKMASPRLVNRFRKRY